MARPRRARRQAWPALPDGPSDGPADAAADRATGLTPDGVADDTPDRAAGAAPGRGSPAATCGRRRSSGGRCRAPGGRRASGGCGRCSRRGATGRGATGGAGRGAAPAAGAAPPAAGARGACAGSRRSSRGTSRRGTSRGRTGGSPGAPPPPAGAPPPAGDAPGSAEASPSSERRASGRRSAHSAAGGSARRGHPVTCPRGSPRRWPREPGCSRRSDRWPRRRQPVELDGLTAEVQLDLAREVGGDVDLRLTLGLRGADVADRRAHGGRPGTEPDTAGGGDPHVELRGVRLPCRVGGVDVEGHRGADLAARHDDSLECPSAPAATASPGGPGSACAGPPAPAPPRWRPRRRDVDIAR